jgi:uncharacterized protein involved in exopolysaccharide biosynthesis
VIPGKQYTPEDIVLIAWRRKWWGILPAIAITVGVYAWVRTLPNLYRSDTLILVVPQRVPENYVKSTVTTRIEDRLQSIQQQILSRTRLERIIQTSTCTQRHARPRSWRTLSSGCAATSPSRSSRATPSG